MIRVERARVSVPKSLDPEDPSLAKAAQEAKEFFRTRLISRRQTSFRFQTQLYKAADVLSALDDLFQGRCAYCETSVSVSDARNVDRFRPRTFASGLNGAIAEDHYWWLAYDWDNLYLCCTICGRLKGRRFPVGRDRAPMEARGAALSGEQPMLVDPCQDDPDEHLVFLEDGVVVGRTERGRVTIEVLGLNREDLLAARRAHLQGVMARIDAAFSGTPTGDWAALIQGLTAERQPHPGASRQVLARALTQRAGVRPSGGGEVRSPLLVAQRFLHAAGGAVNAGLVQVVADALPSIIPAASHVRHLLNEFRQRNKEENTSTFEEPVDVESLLRSTKCIERIVIKNFRRIHHLDLKLTQSTSTSAPWTMLLGENGVGKSSVLQAVALALVGERYSHVLKLEPADLVRHGAKAALVEVHLSNTPTPIKMTIDAKNGIRTVPQHARVLVLGYGATRLLPRAGSSSGTQERYAKADNLFDPFVPVGDPEAWFLALGSREFDTYARALKKLFSQLEGPERLVKRQGRILVRTRSGMIPLRQLSDGYQSVIGITVDLMRVVSAFWPAMEVAEGVVLIDELGAHLHPRWRMRVVAGLRRAFPRIQFIASTHDPLCLRGLEDGEVVVLRQAGDGRTQAVTDLPSVEAMRVEQLLTSEHFGLHSTVDPVVDAEFTRYYDLKASRHRTPEEEGELGRIGANLDRKKVLGKDRRERMMLEVIDGYLAEERQVAEPDRRAALRDGALKTVREIWEEELPAE